ncbi:DUF4347 domain-containing protein, partial [Nisaea nitritireducens]|uniref:DUF4347 domain-containing protein n=1 Tax=Nisaea nitritireducens TaxID=568392 RepID=UPI0018680996
MNHNKRYLFVDPAVHDTGLLTASLRTGTEIHRLAASGDPLAEIAAALSGTSSVRQLSILAHGAPGAVELSGQRIDSAALKVGRHNLYRMRDALAPGAELALISCETGAGPAGAELVETLEEALGVTVYASTRPLGGDAGWASLPVAATLFAAEALHTYPERLAVTGTPSTGNDTLTSDGDADNIDALAGNDVIIGNGGNDTITGGDGNDTLYGGLGEDLVYGNALNDILYGDGGNDTLYGGDGNDSLRAGTGSDVLFGGDGNDTLGSSSDSDTSADTFYGGAGDDFSSGFIFNTGAVFYGGDGNDTVQGPGGAGTGTTTGAVLYGDAGDDWIHSDDGPDTIYGGTGNDTLYGDDDGGKALNLLYGDEGNDVIYAGSKADDGGGGAGNTLYGGTGDDSLYGGSDKDILVGGSGADLFTGASSGAASKLNGDTIHGLEIGDSIYVKSSDLSSLNGSIVGSSISLGGSNAVNIANASSSLQISVSYDGTNSTLTFSQYELPVSVLTKTGDSSGSDASFTLTNNNASATSGTLVSGTGSGNTVTVTLPAGLSLTNRGTVTAVSGEAAGTSLTGQ